jgi:hypothetical protein
MKKILAGFVLGALGLLAVEGVGNAAHMMPLSIL